MTAFYWLKNRTLIAQSQFRRIGDNFAISGDDAHRGSGGPFLFRKWTFFERLFVHFSPIPSGHTDLSQNQKLPMHLLDDAKNVQGFDQSMHHMAKYSMARECDIYEEPWTPCPSMGDTLGEIWT